MEKRFAPGDLRVRRDLVESAVRVYGHVARQGKGRFVFLAGFPGSGRTATLRALRRAIQRAEPRPFVVGGSFLDGHYEPWQPGRRRLGKAAAAGEVAALAGALAGTGGWIGVLASLAGQWLQAGAAVGEVVAGAQTEAQVDSPEALARLLRQLSRHRPVVWLVDDLDRAEGSWLTEVLLALAYAMAVDLPLLVVATLEGAEALGDHEEGEPDVLWLARKLEGDGLGNWWPLAPASREEIAAWLGAAQGQVVEALHSATWGNPRWATLLWDEWREAGAVRQAPWQGAWDFVPGAPEASADAARESLWMRLSRLLPGQGPRLQDETWRLLACAALEGRRFTADALALVFDKDRDALIEFLDDNLVGSGGDSDGLLAELEPLVAIQDPRTGLRYLCRYAFLSEPALVRPAALRVRLR